MFPTFKKSALSLAVASTLVLAGCGGSSSSGPSNPSQPPATSSTTVSGAAVKGVMKNAIVTAYELDGQGGRSSSSVGSARTNDDGEYTVSLNTNYTGGLIDIEVTTDTSTRMVCDASSCDGVNIGDDVTLPEGFKLNAIVSRPKSGGAVSAPVTAWSTLAAKRTQKLVSEGKSTAQAAKQAASEVQQIAGFDFANTPAKSVTNLDGATADEQQAAVMNAVVAELVFSSGNAADQLDAFASALDDGTVGNEGDSFKVAELGKKARSLTNTTPGLDPAAKDALNTQATKNSSVGDEGFKPVDNSDLENEDEASQADKIAAFKEFVTQARTWVSSIEDLDSAALGSAVDIDVNAIQAALGTETVGSLMLAMEVINQSLDAAAIEPTQIKAILENGGTIPLAIKDGGVDVGNASLTVENDSGLKISIVGTVNDQAQTNYLPLDLALETNLSASDLDLDSIVLKRLLASSEITVNGTVNDNDGAVLVELSDVAVQLNLGQVIKGDAGGVSDSQVAQQFSGASLRGNVVLNASTGERFAGEVEAGLTRLTANQSVLSDVPVSLEHLRVAGDFLSATGNVFVASANLNINNASSFDTFAWLDYSNSSQDLYFPIAPDLIGSLLEQVPSDSVDLHASVHVYDTYQGSEGHFNVSGQTGDGQSKYIYYNASQEELPQFGEALKAGLLRSNIRPTVEFEITDVSGPRMVQVDLNQKIQEGQVYQGDWYAGGQNGAMNETHLYASVFVDIPELNNKGAVFAESPLQGNYAHIMYEQGVGLVIEGQGLIADSAKPDVPQNLAAIEGAELIQLTGNMDWASAGLTRPAELVYYDQCLANPQEQLPLLGYGFELNQSGFHPEQACGHATLNYFYDDGPLDAETIGLLDSEVNEKLAENYGVEMASQLDVGYYDFWTNGSNGGLRVDVDFPNLETSQNFINTSLTISANVSIPELPFASVVATATRSSLNGGSLLANVSYGTGEYSVELTSDDIEANDAELNARFFNSLGYELAMSLQLDENGNIVSLTGDALLNGEDIGDVTERSGAPVIVYPNGDEAEFETLF